MNSRRFITRNLVNLSQPMKFMRSPGDLRVFSAFSSTVKSENHPATHPFDVHVGYVTIMCSPTITTVVSHVECLDILSIVASHQKPKTGRFFLLSLKFAS